MAKQFTEAFVDDDYFEQTNASGHSYAEYGELGNGWTTIETISVPKGDYLVCYIGIYSVDRSGYTAVNVNGLNEVAFNLPSNSNLGNTLSWNWILKDVNSIALQAYGACNSFKYRYAIQRLR